MAERVLVTTPLEDSWPKDGPILFLGEWCRLHSRRTVWTNLDTRILPYHWDNRHKLEMDFIYLQDLNELILVELAEALNKIHSVEYGLQYWRLCLGYWLNLLSTSIFDRWEMLGVASAENLHSSLVLDVPFERRVATDTADFLEHALSDEWNHYVYSVLLEELRIVDLVQVPGTLRPRRRRHAGSSIRDHARKALRQTISNFNRVGPCSQADFFLYATRMSLRQEARLSRRLGQRPALRVAPQTPRVMPDPDARQWTLGEESIQTPFESILRRFAVEQIPTIFLEGYGQARYLLARLNWPERPSVIWTTTAHFNDDMFKLWAAARTDRGTKLVTAQHGGAEMGRWNGANSYQRSISDRHLTWGTGSSLNSKETRIGYFTAPSPRVRVPEKGPALLITVAMPRYAFDIRSMVISSQMIEYFDEQFRFFDELPTRIQTELIVRTMASDRGWFQEERWRERFPDVRMDSRRSLRESLRGSRLAVSTYNATTFLEAMAMGVPTVMYWNPARWESTPEAEAHLSRLRAVGVFHEDPESTARHIEAIWEDPHGWWSREDVMQAVGRFTARYGHVEPNSLNRIAAALNSMKPQHPHRSI